MVFNSSIMNSWIFTFIFCWNLNNGGIRRSSNTECVLKNTRLNPLTSPQCTPFPFLDDDVIYVFLNDPFELIYKQGWKKPSKTAIESQKPKPNESLKNTIQVIFFIWDWAWVYHLKPEIESSHSPLFINFWWPSTWTTPFILCFNYSRQTKVYQNKLEFIRSACSWGDRHTNQSISFIIAMRKMCNIKTFYIAYITRRNVQSQTSTARKI